MARTKRDASLDTRTNRLKLKPSKEPVWSGLAEGEHLGYSRPKTLAAGTWKAKWRDKATAKRVISVIGTADDYEDADGIRVLDWAQAQVKARIWFADMARDLRRRADGETTHEGPYTVAMALADYRKDCERRGVKGAERQTYQVNAHILPALGVVEVGKLTRRQIEKWLDALAAAPRRVRQKAPLAPDTPQPNPRVFKNGRKAKEENVAAPKVPTSADEKRARKDSANRVLTILKAALNHAYDRGTVRGETPWRDVKPFRGTSSARVRFLSIEDQVRFVRACTDDFQQLVRAALLTGARYGELTHVTVAEFNREAQTLFIPGHIAKSGKGRHIFLTAEGQQFFNSVVSGRMADENIFLRGGEVERRKRTEAGQKWATKDQDRPMAAACKAAEIASLTFHELRHTAASTWIAAGMDLILVARQLGHSDTRMVEKHYGHLCPDAAAARFRALAPELGILGTEQVAPLQIKTS